MTLACHNLRECLSGRLRHAVRNNLTAAAGRPTAGQPRHAPLLTPHDRGPHDVNAAMNNMEDEMSASMKQLTTSPIFGRDGRAGSLSDILIDDQSWCVRWLVVETGPWLFGREVLLDPQSFVDYDEESSKLHVDLSREQIAEARGIGSDLPFHRQKEAAIPYDDMLTYAPGTYGAVYIPPRVREFARAEDPAIQDYIGDRHLRSAQEVAGYEVAATDGKLGSLQDLLLSDCFCRVEAAVVQTGRWWWPGQELQIDPRWVIEIDWLQQRIGLSRSRQIAFTANEPGARVREGRTSERRTALS